MRSANLLAVLLLVGCTADRSAEPDGDRDRSKRERAEPEASDCGGDMDSPIDVESEPPLWRESVDVEWTDANGCLVRVDVLAEYRGPSHCGWQDARRIVTGDPFGARYSRPENSHDYVRDPKGVYGNRALAEAFDPDATLPDTARDTGYRRGEVELWIDPEDTSALYLKLSTSLERWPRGDVPLCM